MAESSKQLGNNENGLDSVDMCEYSELTLRPLENDTNHEKLLEILNSS
jgi:hypothetical protein